MKMYASWYEFQREFTELRPNNFSCDGLSTLFDYYENYEEETGEEIELDVIAICYTWSEYENLEEALTEYDKDTLEDLEGYTFVIPLENGGYLVQVY